MHGSTVCFTKLSYLVSICKLVVCFDASSVPSISKCSSELLHCDQTVQGEPKNKRSSLTPEIFLDVMDTGYWACRP